MPGEYGGEPKLLKDDAAEALAMCSEPCFMEQMQMGQDGCYEDGTICNHSDSCHGTMEWIAESCHHWYIENEGGHKNMGDWALEMLGSCTGPKCVKVPRAVADRIRAQRC